MNDKNHLNIELLLREGEGLTIEFKEKLSHLDREMVAFANTLGGTLLIGVNDHGHITGIDESNRLQSQITDIAHNCDPSIPVEVLYNTKHNIIIVNVAEGTNKPYRCKDGFFLRNGPSSQKLRRDEILSLIQNNHLLQFESSINKNFLYANDFSDQSFKNYLHLCNIETNAKTEDILFNLGVGAESTKTQPKLNNAGVLFFANNPQLFFPEAFITCALYKKNEKFSLLTKKECTGNPIQQIEQALLFLKQHIATEIYFSEQVNSELGQRQEQHDYPFIALREAIINAVVHRDYQYLGSHIYIHIYPDYIDIENPGGLYRGLKLENITKRSVRRNPLIADLLHRAKYIERVGSGFSRMIDALEKNHNPPMEIHADNFFTLRFHKRLKMQQDISLTTRQIKIYNLLEDKGIMNITELAQRLELSNDTVRRDLNHLLALELISKQGQGRSTRYSARP
jgi:ATP-dependent DNA helicase RecG